MLSWQAGIWVLLQKKHFGFQKSWGYSSHWGTFAVLPPAWYLFVNVVMGCSTRCAARETKEEQDNYTGNRDF